MDVESSIRELRRLVERYLRATERSAAPMLSMAEASKQLGISEPTLMRLALRGLCHTVMIGGRRKVSAREVQRIQAEGADTRPSAPNGKTGARGAAAGRTELRRQRR